MSAESGSPPQDGGFGSSAHREPAAPASATLVVAVRDDWSVSVGSIQGSIPEEDLVSMAEVVSDNLP